MPSLCFPKSLSATVALLLFSSALSLPSLANETNNIRQGLPGRRISGGVRLNPTDSCFSDFNQSLVAVIPRSNLGKTTAARPTFWFSMPETSGSKVGEFQLFNNAEEMVFSTHLTVADNLGLSEFQLPETAPELAMNENYRWVFSVACTATTGIGRADTPTLGLQGWVRRVESPAGLASQLSTASLEEQVSLYAAAGLWHEQVTTLMNLRRNNPGNMNLQLAWASLLQANGLTRHASHNISEAMLVTEPTELLTNRER